MGIHPRLGIKGLNDPSYDIVDFFISMVPLKTTPSSMDNRGVFRDPSKGTFGGFLRLSQPATPKAMSYNH